jgi:GT2 family glycosyltransferase
VESKKVFNIAFQDNILRKFRLVERAVLILRKEGFAEFARRVGSKLCTRRDYRAWWESRKLSKREIEEIRIVAKSFRRQPRISILMPVYDIEKRYLEKAINSVLIQLYENWELCIADDYSSDKAIGKLLEEASRRDGRIKVQFLDKNNGIAAASNAAAKEATGEYITTLDHDDELSINALYEVVKIINDEDPDVIYSDEDFIDKKGRPLAGHFKPDFSPDLLTSHNYITHLSVIRKSIFDDIKGFSSEYDGAQDYDLILKACEKAKKIVHVPKVLYHWRRISSSTSANPESKRYAVAAGREALESALKRRAVSADVFEEHLMFYYRVKRRLIRAPLVSVIVYSRGRSDKQGETLKVLMQKTAYRNYEVVVLEEEAHSGCGGLSRGEMCGSGRRLRIVRREDAWSLAKALNGAVNVAEGEHIVLVEDNVEVVSPEWLESLLENSQREEVGVVGAKLCYPDQTLHHAGIILGIRGFFGFSHRNLGRNEHGYYNRINCVQNVSAVSGALMMVKKGVHRRMDGFDERQFGFNYWDVDFCLRSFKAGYLNVYTPYCEGYYHTRKAVLGKKPGRERNGLEVEREAFLGRWNSLIAVGDPYYNQNLTLEKEDFSLRMN